LIDLGVSMAAGYLRISYFAESTPQQVRDVLLKGATDMRYSGGLRGLIVDVRGNPGGLFRAGVGVAELFLPEGIIVISQSPFKEYNRPFKVEASGPFQMPIVVLIDGETASAAEVLAGALKEGRATRAAPTVVVGQTSYGKGSIQCIIPLEKGLLERPTAIRLTVAKLFSPTNQPYTGRGVTPDEGSVLEGEALLQEARKRLRELILGLPDVPGPRPPMPPKPMLMGSETTM
jgi:carboxyl-terminal processing protease